MVNKRCITNYHFQFVWLETTYHHQILFNDRSGFQEPFTPTDVGLLNQETWTDIYLVLPTADFPQFIQGCNNLIIRFLRLSPICFTDRLNSQRTPGLFRHCTNYTVSEFIYTTKQNFVQVIFLFFIDILWN